MSDKCPLKLIQHHKEWTDKDGVKHTKDITDFGSCDGYDCPYYKPDFWGTYKCTRVSKKHDR